MTFWKNVKLQFDAAKNTIVVQTRVRRTMETTTKYINSKDEFDRWQWFLDQVWNARFRWDPAANNGQGGIVKID